MIKMGRVFTNWLEWKFGVGSEEWSVCVKMKENRKREKERERERELLRIERDRKRRTLPRSFFLGFVSTSIQDLVLLFSSAWTMCRCKCFDI